MIFSSAKWNSAGEIRPYVSVAKSLAFDVMQAPLRNAFEMFIRPLLGETMTADLIGYYAAVTPSDKQTGLVQLAQRANAFLAFWYDYAEINVLITDAGVRRQESDTAKTPYKYQEQALKTGWKEKGFNALDDLLQYLEINISTFEHFSASPNFTSAKTDIVRNASDIDNYYFINNSRILYLRLRPHLRTVVNTIVAPRMGDTYAELLTELVKTSPDAKFVKLRESLVPVVVFYAVSRLIRETGSLTDKGLFFDTQQSTDDANYTTPATDTNKNMQATMAESDAISYWKIAERMLKADFGYTTTTSRVPKRDNNDKKAFWG